MPLVPGTRLGPYEIVAAIGAGGMGEVYRAVDTNLKRATAIKVLPESFAADPERLSRFQREAEVLASLNHPNIAAVYSLERSGMSVAMAMELVEGPTLADRIADGAIPTDEALGIARQITEGLEAAHERTIVHRDLKPTNIKVRPDGTVKILDFGLAKAVEPTSVAPGSLSLSPTITSPAMTQLGMVLGTAAYMSPEQARGRPVDKRADIWAFGCVLCEMLTGRPAFEGEDVSLTFAEIMKSEPDWKALPPLPPAVLICLKQCLVKDPRSRLRDIGEMRLALSGTFDVQSLAPASTAPTVGNRNAWPWALGSAVVAALAATAITLWTTRAPDASPPQVVRFQIHAPAGSRIPPGTAAISPDGRALVYAIAGTDGIPKLHLRRLDSTITRPLPGTENAVHPIWSPDGESISFVSDRTLKRLDLAGGFPRELAQVTGPWHGSWGRFGDILFSQFGVYRISADGGKTVAAVTLDEKAGETASTFPVFLEDGKRFLVRVERDDETSFHLASLDSPERKLVLKDVVSAPLLAPTPHGPTYLMYLRDESLVAQELDERSGTVQGTQHVVVERIGRVANPPLQPTAAVSPAGVLAYQEGGEFTSMVLNWVNWSGAPVGEVRLDVTGQNPTLSPNGRLLAMDATSREDRDIWVADVNRGVTTVITHGGGADRSPAWSPDGRRLAFSRAKKIYVIAADGSGAETVLADVDGMPQSWSADGKYLLYQTNRQLYLWPFSGGAPIPVGARSGFSRLGQFSPDGRAISYTSNESGREEIYVQMTPPATGRIRVSTSGGYQAQWGRTSQELFFQTLDRTMMTADVTVGDTLSAGVPRKLFTTDAAPVFSNLRYGVDLNGHRFLIPRLLGDSLTDTPITVVLNWWTEFVKRPSDQSR